MESGITTGKPLWSQWNWPPKIWGNLIALSSSKFFPFNSPYQKCADRNLEFVPCYEGILDPYAPINGIFRDPKDT